MVSEDVHLLHHDSTSLLVRPAYAMDCPCHQSAPLTGISCCLDTHNILRAKLGDTASNLLASADSLRKICRPSHSPVASTSRSYLSASKRAPVFLIDHTPRSLMGSLTLGGSSPRSGSLTGACTRADSKKFFLLNDTVVHMTCEASIGQFGTASARFCCEVKKYADDIGCKYHNKGGKAKSKFHTLSPNTVYAPAKINRGKATAYIAPSLSYSRIDEDLMDTLKTGFFGSREAVDLINHINTREDERELAEAQLEDEKENGYDTTA